MRHTRIKMIRDKNGKSMFFLRDGLWFGQINKRKAWAGLASGEYNIWSWDGVE